MGIDEAIELALTGEALAFFGAGVSTHARNFGNKSLMTGGQLVGFFQDLLSEPDESDLGILAEEYIQRNGEHELISLISQLFSCRDVDQCIHELLKVPWITIYTTNYDNVIESVLASQDRPFLSVTTNSAQPNFKSSKSNDQLICVHINGSISNLSVQGLHRDIRLTDVSYVTTSFLECPWVTKFRADIQRSGAVFFIGYSAYDLDIKRILFENPEFKRKCFFVNGPVKSPARRTFFETYGQLTDLKVDAFVEKLASKKKTFVRREAPAETQCFEKIELPDELKEFRDRDAIDLLIYGKSQDELFYTNATIELNQKIGNRKRYVITRDVENFIMTNIEKKTYFHVHSALGNGKTVLLKQLSTRLRIAGYSVFWLKDSYFDEYFSSDLKVISKSGPRTVIIIDNIYRIEHIFDQLFATPLIGVTIIASSRTAINETRFGSILQRLPDAQSYQEIDINQMSSDDIEKLDDHLLSLGLWEEGAKLSKESRLRTIEIINNAELQSVLIRIVEAFFVRQKLVELFQTRDISSEMRRIIFAYYVLVGVGENRCANPLVISEITGIDFFKMYSSYSNSDFVREFVRLTGSAIESRSPVFAKVFLKSMAHEQKYFVDNIIDILSKIDGMGRFNIPREYWNIFTTISKFSVIEPMLSNKQKREWLVYYYEKLSSFQNCVENDHFWLHYAMARMAFHEYDVAERYLNTARGISIRRGISDDFQIQNQFARLRLMRCIHTDKVPNYFGEFIEANRIFSNQMRKESESVAAFRWTILYWDFFEKYRNGMDEGQKALFKAACRHAVHLIDNAHPSVRLNKRVENARNRLSDVVSWKT